MAVRTVAPRAAALACWPRPPPPGSPRAGRTGSRRRARRRRPSRRSSRIYFKIAVREAVNLLRAHLHLVRAVRQGRRGGVSGLAGRSTSVRTGPRRRPARRRQGGACNGHVGAAVNTPLPSSLLFHDSFLLFSRLAAFTPACRSPPLQQWPVLMVGEGEGCQPALSSTVPPTSYRQLRTNSTSTPRAPGRGRLRRRSGGAPASGIRRAPP